MALKSVLKRLLKSGKKTKGFASGKKFPVTAEDSAYPIARKRLRQKRAKKAAQATGATAAAATATSSTDKDKPKSKPKTTPKKSAPAKSKPKPKTTKRKSASSKIRFKQRPQDPRQNKPVATKKTKGGDYKVYRKSSLAAGNFRSAYAAAKKAGKGTFTWNGRKYKVQDK